MILTITVLIYLALVFIVGIYAGRGNGDTEESYFLGKRGFGPVATAISAGATDSSGWIFIGAVGFSYTMGAVTMWMLPSFVVGVLFNWLYLGPRLRKQGKNLGALGVADFFEKKLNDKSHLVKIIAGFLIVIFFIPYMASQLTAAGKTINVLLEIDYNIGLIGSAIFVIAYCFSGGYKSVVFTDVVQGFIMLGVLFFFPLYLTFSLGGWGELWAQLLAVDPILGSAAAGATGSAAFGFIAGLLFYGLGEVGQPHILQRFFSAKDDHSLAAGTWIASAWAVIVMTGSSILGLCARLILPDLADPEFAFPATVIEIMPAIIAGIVVGAIFAAIQSTFSSQLLLAVQTISSDLLKSFSKKEYSQEQLIKYTRITMIILGLIVTGLALANIDTVFALVVYAWSGMASAFGPLLVFLVAAPQKVSKWGAIAGMIIGTLSASIWYVAGLSAYMMEVVPGMICATLAILIVSKVIPDQSVTAESPNIKL
ncbi:SSS family solute:Na+ symporter/sodium/proline symporter [Cytobacillus oceanisediminis]|uniref:Sodium/proline symporter n=1 Tax=Cytobacillus oceanisediminis TaxID=665099 RepID=A0A2V3A3N8_9BACI|nr:sodium/proline symporter [Cytobacillus oceanisediminis]PWW31322.1 SSS family solute:Na+ symporter/sodium/proline symporter [Cytobacillus oceanisediminis]